MQSFTKVREVTHTVCGDKRNSTVSLDSESVAVPTNNDLFIVYCIAKENADRKPLYGPLLKRRRAIIIFEYFL